MTTSSIPDDEHDHGARRADLPVGRLARIGPRTAGFMARSARRNLPFRSKSFPEIPTRPTTAGLMASVLADELLLAFMSSDRLVPTELELARIEKETTKAVDVLGQHGWLDDPSGFHQEPPPPPYVEARRMHFGRVRYDELTFDSGYQPVAGLPGADRWHGFVENRTMRAYVMKHREGPRPWLVNIHGFSMGHPSDLSAFRSLHFHRELGYDVIHPVLPLHGPRKLGKRSGDGIISFDYLNNLHGVTQAVWDIRRCITWARQQGGTSVSVHGVSLGAFTAALLAGLDDRLDAVVCGVPTVDLAWVMRQHVPKDARRSVEERGLLGDRADAIHSVISPLSFPCTVESDRRFIYAGVADRMATPQQAHRLWKHWDEPAICWYSGSHVSFTLSREVRRFVEKALVDSRREST